MSYFAYYNGLKNIEGSLLIKKYSLLLDAWRKTSGILIKARLCFHN